MLGCLREQAIDDRKFEKRLQSWAINSICRKIQREFRKYFDSKKKRLAIVIQCFWKQRQAVFLLRRLKLEYKSALLIQKWIIPSIQLRNTAARKVIF